MRDAMPSIARFIDDHRAEFGADQINASIKGGMAGDGSFYAAENGIEIGSRPAVIPDRVVSGADFAKATPCDGCTHFFLRQLSPAGDRQQRCCRIYKIAASKCADWSKK